MAIAINTNGEQAFLGYLLWLSDHPGDYVGATEMASCDIESGADIDDLEALIRGAETGCQRAARIAEEVARIKRHTAEIA